MKPNIELTEENAEGVATCASEQTRRIGESGTDSKAGIPKRFRLLKWNERVCLGDFVADENQQLKPWEGPSGFQADSFVKPIYRSNATSKLK